MKTIQISEIYPVHKVHLASELVYICELAKYAFINHQTQISLDGVILSDVLKKSKYWLFYKIAVINKWVTGVPECEPVSEMEMHCKDICNVLITDEEIEYDKAEWSRRASDEEFNFFTPVATQVFLFIDKDLITWSLNGFEDKHSMIQSTSLLENNATQRFVSLVAYVAIERFFANNVFRFKLICDYTVAYRQLCMADIICLCERTNALDDWFTLEYNCSPAEQKRMGYEAWWHMGHEMGFMDREYTDDEKKIHLKKLDIQVGDVVCYFKRKASHKSNFIKSIDYSNFAIVRAITKKGISLDKVLTMKTPYARQKEFDALKTAEKAMFKGQYKTDSYNYELVTIPWMDLGIDFMMYKELDFITPVQLDNKTTMPVLSKKDNKEILVEVDAPNFLYWLFSEYKVSFNKDRFVERYLSSKPVYERYLEGEF